MPKLLIDKNIRPEAEDSYERIGTHEDRMSAREVSQLVGVNIRIDLD